MISTRKINKIPEFYMILARKTPAFYIIIVWKIFSRFFFFGGGGARAPSLVVYAYDKTKSKSYSEDDESLVVGLSRWFIRLTIQLNNRPYNALAIASLTPAASVKLFCRTIVSPRAIIPDVVSDSLSSPASTPSRPETTHRSTEADLDMLRMFGRTKAP